MFGGESSGYAKSSPGKSDTGTKVDKNNNITQDPPSSPTPPANVVAQEAVTTNIEDAISAEGTNQVDPSKITPAMTAEANRLRKEARERDALETAKEAADLAKLDEDKNNGKGQTINKKARGRSTVLTVNQNMRDNARVKKDANQDKRLDMKLHMDAYDAEIHGTDKNAYRKEGKKVTRKKALTHRSEALKRKMAKEEYVGGQIAGSIVDTQENSNASNTDAALINQAEINTSKTDKEEVVVVNDPPREKIDKKKFKETEVGKKVTGLYKKYQEKKKKRKEKKEKEKGDE